MTEWEQRVLALAGLCQAAACVQQLAMRGEVIPSEALNPLVHSVLAINAESLEDIYANDTNYAISNVYEADDLMNKPHPLRIGLQIFLGLFAGDKNNSAEHVKLILKMLQLERALNSNSAALKELGAGLTQVARQKNEFNVDNYRIYESLAGLYSGIISPLQQPIRVNGQPKHLEQRTIQNQVRTLLLAGIRSAVLWRQLGGKKRNFIFHRSAMQQAATSLLSTSL